MNTKSELIKLEKYKNFDNIEKTKFRALIKDSFNKELSSDYFSYAKPKTLIIAKDKQNYLGAVVVEKINKDIDYLDKIAVATNFQGNGIGKRMLSLLGDETKLVWRAKENNPINDFYKKQCDGMQKSGNWIIYWKGLTFEEIEIGITYALSKKETLGEIK